jgi:hypothetical protein
LTYWYISIGTDEAYACSALVAIQKLLLTKPHSSISIVLLHNNNLPVRIKIFWHCKYLPVAIRDIYQKELSIKDFWRLSKMWPDYKFELIGETLDEQYAIKKNNGYYRDCHLKLFLFSLTQFERIIFMDSDG